MCLQLISERTILQVTVQKLIEEHTRSHDIEFVAKAITTSAAFRHFDISLEAATHHLMAARLYVKMSSLTVVVAPRAALRYTSTWFFAATIYDVLFEWHECKQIDHPPS